LAENPFFEEFCRQIGRHINDVSDHGKETSKISKNTTKVGKRKQVKTLLYPASPGKSYLTPVKVIIPCNFPFSSSPT
jgi:hypothetical protein